MPTVKKVNYTPEQEQEMEMVYTSIEEGAKNDKERAKVVADFAVKFDKTPASIRSKMSREQYYIKPEKVSKATGEKIVRKPELVAQLAVKLGVPTKEAESGEKATVSFLKLVLARMSDLESRIAEFEAVENQDIEVDNPVTD